MKILKLSDSNDLAEIGRIHANRMTQNAQQEGVAQQILNEISQVEDPMSKIFEYTKKLDHWEIDERNIEIDPSEWSALADRVDPKIRKALANAAKRIRAFHERQMEELDTLSWAYDEIDSDIRLGQQVRPLEAVGVYIPGGRAVYPSTVLMNTIPAKVAGVQKVVMVCPTPGGTIEPILIAAALEAGVDCIFRIGGAQAVAALAFGCDPVPRVDKIVGPGNAYVQAAKKAVFGAVDIDMIAGPSEVLILADKTANPRYVAADLLSQAEHDPLAAAVLVTDDKALGDAVIKEVEKQLPALATRETAEASIRDYGMVILTEGLEQSIEVANEIAPEHLELCIDPDLLDETAPAILNAGAIFMGNHTPEPVGDYLAGPNHVLPTGGSARFFSPLGVYDFIKRTSILKFGKADLENHGPDIVALAEAEGFPAHANAVRVRLNKDPK